MMSSKETILKGKKGSVLHVNDDFEIHIITDKIPANIKKMKPNAEFSGPIEAVTEKHNGYYTEEDAENIKFYVLSNDVVEKKVEKKKQVWG